MLGVLAVMAAHCCQRTNLNIIITGQSAGGINAALIQGLGFASSDPLHTKRLQALNCSRARIQNCPMLKHNAFHRHTIPKSHLTKNCCCLFVPWVYFLSLIAIEEHSQWCSREDTRFVLCVGLLERHSPCVFSRSLVNNQGYSISHRQTVLIGCDVALKLSLFDAN